MIKRRDLIALLGGAATWPLAARAQGDVPVVGYLSSFSPETNRKFTEAFREGLNEQGFREGRNVNIEYRWAEEGRYDALPTMAVVELTPLDRTRGLLK
jgi:putative tryptophan/tyrosine transport system substrate-binding protein